MGVQVSNVDCVVPTGILECAGTILCVPAYALSDPSRVTETAFGHSVRRALISLLRNNVGLMFVLYAADNTYDIIRRARKSLPVDLRCRVIGSAVGTTVTGPQPLCEAWQRSYSPRLPFSILDEMKIKGVAAVDLQPRSRILRKQVVEKLNSVAGIQNRPVIIRPLRGVEMVRLSAEAYINGLGSLALELIKPLIGYWKIQPDTIGHVLGTPRRSSADYYGELSRHLKLRFHVYAVHTRLFGSPPIRLDVDAVIARVAEQEDKPFTSPAISPAPFVYESSSIPDYIDQIDANGNRITGLYIDGKFISKAVFDD